MNQEVQNNVCPPPFICSNELIRYVIVDKDGGVLTPEFDSKEQAWENYIVPRLQLANVAQALRILNAAQDEGIEPLERIYTLNA